MSAVGPGNPVVKRICDALGIENARMIVISMSLDDVVTVDAFFMATESQLSGVADVLEQKRYRLVEAEQA